MPSKLSTSSSSSSSSSPSKPSKPSKQDKKQLSSHTPRSPRSTQTVDVTNAFHTILQKLRTRDLDSLLIPFLFNIHHVLEVIAQAYIVLTSPKHRSLSIDLVSQEKNNNGYNCLYVYTLVVSSGNIIFQRTNSRGKTTILCPKPKTKQQQQEEQKQQSLEFSFPPPRRIGSVWHPDDEDKNYYITLLFHVLTTFLFDPDTVHIYSTDKPKLRQLLLPSTPSPPKDLQQKKDIKIINTNTISSLLKSLTMKDSSWILHPDIMNQPKTMNKIPLVKMMRDYSKKPFDDRGFMECLRSHPIVESPIGLLA